MNNFWSRREWLRTSGLAAGTWAVGGLAPSVLAAGPQQSTPASNVATVEFQRSIPVRREVDVFVAGGGPAGVDRKSVV